MVKEYLLGIGGAILITATVPLTIEADHYLRSPKPDGARQKAELIAVDMDSANLPLPRSEKAKALDGSNLHDLPVRVMLYGSHSLYGYVAWAAEPNRQKAEQELAIVMPYHGFFDTPIPPADISAKMAGHHIQLKNGVEVTLKPDSLYAKTDFELACYRATLDLNQSEPFTKVSDAYGAISANAKTEQFENTPLVDLLDVGKEPLKIRLTGYTEKDEVNLSSNIKMKVVRIYNSLSEDTKAGDSGRLMIYDNAILGMLISGTSSTASAKGKQERKNPRFSSADNLAEVVNNCVR